MVPQIDRVTLSDLNTSLYLNPLCQHVTACEGDLQQHRAWPLTSLLKTYEEKDEVLYQRSEVYHYSTAITSVVTRSSPLEVQNTQFVVTQMFNCLPVCGSNSNMCYPISIHCQTSAEFQWNCLRLSCFADFFSLWSWFEPLFWSPLCTRARASVCVCVCMRCISLDCYIPSHFWWFGATTAHITSFHRALASMCLCTYLCAYAWVCPHA